MVKKVFKLTKEGVAKLEAELVQLKSQRGDIAEKIAAARDFGDLSENSEYDAARTEQGLVETRIAELEDIIANVQLIKEGAKNSSATLGSRVTVKPKGNGHTKDYAIVGAVEANPLEGKISDESPIGQSILGKQVGDCFNVKTPKGETLYEIVAIN